MKRGVLILMVVFLILIVSVSADKVDYRVEEELGSKEEVFVIVMLNDDVSVKKGVSALSDGLLNNRKSMVKRQQDKVLSELRLEKWEKGEKKLLSKSKDYDFKLKHSYSVINGFSGKVTKEGLEKLRNDLNVARIHYDNIKYLSLDKSVDQINADDVWGLRPNGTNLTGLGQTVCIIDTGVDYNHTNLGGGWGNKVISGYNSISGAEGGKILGNQSCDINNTACYDDHGHGTHVAGIIVSNHTTYKGVAPDAKIVSIKACDSSGSCADSDVIAGIDWCTNNASKFNISVISMSLGGGGPYNTYCNDDSIAPSINTAVGEGIFVSVASGNEGWSNGISSPACVENATAVGAVNANDVINYNRAPNMVEILAPGIDIYSTYVPNTFTSLTGTSMAAPHVAGVAALMLQFNSSLSALDIRRIMNDTGKAIDDSGTTYKRVDALAAIQSMDKVAPIWYGNATNNTAPKNNDVVQFNVTFNDTIGLSFYLFSWNDTGSWVNIPNGTLSGTSQSISVNQTVTATRGTRVYWRFYANDTNDNWNMTDEWNFIVGDNIPNVPTLNFPANNSVIRVNYTLLNWTATDDDNNTMDCYVYGGNQSNTTSLINITKDIANGSSSVYNWSSLNETTYYWKVQCDDNSSNSSNSSLYQFTVAIPPTTYPTLTSVADYDSDGNIEINWSDDGNETRETYRIYRFTSNITSINSSVTNVTSGITNGTQFFEDNTTTNGTTYWYALVTVDAAGNYDDSIFSNTLNGTANDTIKPKTVTNLNVTGSGATATLRWYNVSKDINENSDFHNLQYVIYYGTNFNSSKTLANESISSYSTATVSTNTTSISVTSSGTYHFIVTTLDDGGNKNLTLDYSNNYGNTTLTYTAPQNNNGGGGGGGSTCKANYTCNPISSCSSAGKRTEICTDSKCNKGSYKQTINCNYIPPQIQSESEEEENITIEESISITEVKSEVIPQNEEGFFVITGRAIMDTLRKPSTISTLFVLFAIVSVIIFWFYRKKST